MDDELDPLKPDDLYSGHLAANEHVAHYKRVIDGGRIREKHKRKGYRGCAKKRCETF